MGARFRRSRGRVEARFDDTERALLVGLFASLAELLADAGAGPASADPLEAMVGPPAGDELPEDPVLARLFPDAYADRAASAEFRRYTEGELRTGKLDNLRRIIDELTAGTGRLSLEVPAAENWLTALNDLRLALGTRLNVTEETLEELERRSLGDPAAAQLRVYEWLGYLQETLVRSLPRPGS